MNIRISATPRIILRLTAWLALAAAATLGMSLSLGHAADKVAPAGSWSRVDLQGLPMWVSESGDWRAEVDPSRGRLTYLGPRRGPNFLNAPAQPADTLQFGGHRVWLGPQSEWKPFWPPPRQWEMAPAESIQARDGNILELESPPGPGDAVAIRRTYRWCEAGKLECAVSWKETTPRGRQAIQIFQIAEGAVIEATPASRLVDSAPRGFIRLPLSTRATTERVFDWPAQATKSATGDTILLRRKPAEEKLGFPLQTLTARWPQGELHLHPGTSTGNPQGATDADTEFPSQVYLGADAAPFVEIEQLSQRLLPSQSDGRVSHTVIVELRHP
ncbi:hypothetical protein DB346_16320 [Verrucomicrobia bacterium LW23]|nr:hypothetical protein DB346_16320 [Verrucomicrobia bacterium LW23]